MCGVWHLQLGGGTPECITPVATVAMNTTEEKALLELSLVLLKPSCSGPCFLVTLIFLRGKLRHYAFRMPYDSLCTDTR